MADLKFLHESLYHDLSKIVNKKITIFGCGAIGANLAVSLARRGFDNFMLVDYDKISEHNMSTQPWSMQDLGRLKTVTLANMIYGMTRAKCAVVSNKVSSTKHGIDSDIFIDCFDNHVSRQIVQDMASIGPVLHVGMSNQNTGEVTWAERYHVPPDVKLNDPCNYPMSRTLVDLTVVATSESVIEFFDKGIKKNLFINANTLQIKNN